MNDLPSCKTSVASSLAGVIAETWGIDWLGLGLIQVSEFVRSKFVLAYKVKELVFGAWK